MNVDVMARASGPIPLDVAFRVEAGELLALVGHSGSGKTTILRTIAGLWAPVEARVVVGGSVWLDTSAGVDLPAWRRHAGVVFQSYALFPHMTAAQNVMAAMNADQSDRKAEAERLLTLVNLPGLSDRKPAQLSGGQQQRVALARALARKPAVLLLDEPFSAVDRATREKLHSELMELRTHLNMPMILVTHDMTEAQILADRMVVIEGGRAVASGATNEVLADPQAIRALGLRETGSIVTARVVGQDADGMTRLSTAVGPIWVPRVDADPGAVLKIRILAHDVMLSDRRPEGLSALNILPVTVEQIREGGGPGVLVSLQVGDEILLCRITQRSALALKLAPGAKSYAVLKSLSIARERIHG